MIKKFNNNVIMINGNTMFNETKEYRDYQFISRDSFTGHVAGHIDLYKKILGWITKYDKLVIISLVDKQYEYVIVEIMNYITGGNK